MIGKVILIFACFSIATSSPPLQLAENSERFYHSKLQHEQEIGTQAVMPPSLNPQSYNIKLLPVLEDDSENNLQEWTIPGSIEIVGEAVIATSNISLNRHPSLQINSSSLEVRNSNNVSIAVTGISNPSNSDVVVISLANDLILNETYTISMTFLAVIQDGTSGLYRGYYTDKNGNQKRIAVTQFESKGARRAFPCFDEPSFNSKFTISLARRNDTGYSTLCNANQRQTGVPHETLRGWVWDHYAETVKMPTYLVAIVITDFAFEEAPNGLFDKPVKIYGAPELINERKGGVFSATISAKVMSNLQEIFEHKYEMPKLDSVAVPGNYFSPGAMENWGLITYRDNLLLYYTGETQETEKQSISSVIAHEQAHQWFGNLVTCKYWSHIWLNEGFATYVAQLSLSQIYPAFEQRREFLVGSVQGSMDFDIGPNQPILNLEADLDEQTSSGTIIYDKGGSVIRMMEGFLGFETLRTALVAYLNKYAYQSAVQDDLFNTMQDHVKDKIPADKTMKEIMDTWTTQPGYPLIRVTRAGNNLVNISQERFLPAGQTSPQNGSWEVPIPIVTANSGDFSNHTPAIWLEKDTLSTTYSHDTSKWIILNPDGFGYYRVMYDNELVKLIQAQLNSDQSAISGLTRSQLVNDYFTFAQLGHGNITTALDMTTSFAKETDFVVWFPLFKHLTKTLQMFSNRNITNLRSYLAPKLDNALYDVGWIQEPSEAGTKVIYRSRLADWACSLESEQCQNVAKYLLLIWKDLPSVNPIGLDLQPVLYCAIVAQGEGGYDFIKEQYNSPNTTDFQKARLLNALSCTKKENEIRNLLDLALDPTSVISRSTVAVYQRVAANSAGRRIVIDLIQDDVTFSKLKEHTGGVNFFSSIVSSLSTYLNSELERDDLQSFIDSRRDELSSVMNSLNNSLNTIRNNGVWMNDNFNIMNSWFASHI